ncbi:hypothetical protein IWW48_005443 [Coemansia sp. RSA 1200]|nr:hypothetical protein IWW48_005443 [Coemansia sp. RSA 1200]
MPAIDVASNSNSSLPPLSHFLHSASGENDDNCSCLWPHVRPFGIDVAAAVGFFEEHGEVSDSGRTTTDWSRAFRRRLGNAYMKRTTDGGDTVARELALATLFAAYAQPGSNSALRSLQQLVAEMVVRTVFPKEEEEEEEDIAQQWWFARFTRDSATRREWVRWWARVPAGVARHWAAVLEADALDSVRMLRSGFTSDYAVARQVADDPVRWTAALEMLRIVDDASVMLEDCRLGFVERVAPRSSSSSNSQRPAGACGDANCAGDSDFCAPRTDIAVDVSSTRICACFEMRTHTAHWMRSMHVRSIQSRIGSQSQSRSRSQPKMTEDQDDYETNVDAWGEANAFSLFLYPFLFDSTAKAELVWIEAFHGMAQRFSRARGRQAQVLWMKELLGTDTTEWRLLASSAAAVGDATNPYFLLDVRRDHAVQDAVDTLVQSCSASAASGTQRARFVLKTRFVLGGELGADMGGVQKELFALLLTQLLAPDAGLFEFAEDAETDYLWPRAASPHALAEFEAVGALLGLALRNRIALGASAPLAPLLVAQLLPSELESSGAAEPLAELLATVGGTFPQLTTGLQQLLDWDEAAGGAVEDVFCRAFEVSVDDPLRLLGLPHATALLVDGGAEIPVTAANRRRYARRHLQFVAFERTQPQIDALRRGFVRVADGVAFRMLRAADLVGLLCPPSAAAAAVDAAELERCASYEDGYHASHATVRCFWRIVHDLSEQRLRRLLAFVTASDRVPFGGYSRLTFVVQRHGPDSEHLPSAITCFGRLLLPQYASEAKMRCKLLMAIDNSSGFGLL